MPESLSETIVRASRPVRYAAAVALAVLALFLLVKTFDAIAQFGTGPNRPINSITVTGEGKSTSVPNIALVTFTVQETAVSVKEAQDAATKRTNDSLAAMKDMDIAEKDIKTLGYNVYPQYENRAIAPCYPGGECPTQSNKISGYQVSQTVEVKIRDTAKAGDVLQKLGTLGVQNISGPNFMLDDDSTVRDEAREAAIEDARAKAEVLAKQLHVRLGNVMSFSEGGGYYPMYSGYAKGGVAMDAANVAPAPSLPVGENETNVTVQITYEIR
ncbi:MAG: hypothetical protein AB202_03345 [Parcubacteria bacterium C7867-007]|nr:MAG: hypothetical protein AB202_03345 [Parcubacteria bacterium C7867-007]